MLERASQVQGLKPDLPYVLFGTTKQAAEKVGNEDLSPAKAGSG